jgi:phenylalanyl-tRNA synthetase beta chain
MVDSSLSSEQILRYLKRSGLRGEVIDDSQYRVWVPFWRADILHACDIIEDISICYGYKNIKPKLPKSSTSGARVHLNKFGDFLRQEMAQAQNNEVLNFTLCSIPDMTTTLLNEDQSHLIHIQSAKTKEFQTARTTLLPGLLRNIQENKANSLPYRLFELGDCVLLDPNTDTGAYNSKRLAAVLTNEVK